jgi:Domain of unknown function (DUF4126)
MPAIMSFTTANITALIVAASFAAGLNIYATVLTLGILARTQWVPLPPGLDSLGHTWVLVACAIMFAIEFVVDKIPALDMAWNVLHTVVRVPIAGLVAYNASAHLSPQMQIMATAIGAAIALATHTSKTAVRAAVTPSPEPISNIALSTTEDAVAVGITWFATHHPIIAAALALIFLASGIIAARALLRAIQRPIQRILSRPEAVQKPPELG